MNKFSPEARNFIIHCHADGVGYTTIKRLLLQEKGVEAGRTSIRALIKKFNETGSVSNKKKTVQIKFGLQEHKNFIDACMEQQADMSAKTLQGRIREEFDLQVSYSRIRTVRRELGWVLSRTRYGQMVRDVNQVKRREWAQVMLDNQETFEVCYIIVQLFF